MSAVYNTRSQCSVFAMADAELKALSGVSHGFIDEDAVPGTVRLVDIADSHGGQHHKRNRDIILVPTPSSDPGKFIHVQ